MNTYIEVEVRHYAFLIMALDGRRDWSTSGPGRFTSLARVTNYLWPKGQKGLWAGLGFVENIKISAFA